jgi:RHS repeat-associated protein
VSYHLPLFTVSQSPLSLPFTLSYHSGTPFFPTLVSSPVGLGWTHEYAQTLRPTDGSNATLYQVLGDGLEGQYQLGGDGAWHASLPGILRGTVTKDTPTNRYLLADLNGTITAFDVTTGRWLSTTDRWGNQIAGTYDGSGHLTTLTDSMSRQVTLSYTGSFLTGISLPDGQSWTLGYTGNNLTQVFDPFHSSPIPWRAFSYQADSVGVVRLLTQVLDDAGFLLEGHSYDTRDRGTTSVSQGGKNQVTVAYDTPSSGQRQVTHVIDGTTTQTSTFTLVYQKAQYLPTSVVGSCSSCGGGSDSYSFIFDANNNVQQMTDGKSHVTTFGYNADGNVTSRTEASGTPVQRATSYVYGYAAWPNFRTQVTEPSAAKPGSSKVTTMAWNATGTPETTLTVSESGYLLASDANPTTYTTTSTFDARHRLLSVDGPRTDVSDLASRTYYADNDATADRRGRLQTVTDAVGLSSAYDNYDVFGTPRTTTDPNGVQTTRITDAKGRVTSTTVQPVASDPNETTAYTTSSSFDTRDRLTLATSPRGNKTAYVYEDGTNRLTDTVREDAAGVQYERRHLTLNVIGDRIKEEDQSCGTPAVSCVSWTTKRTESYVFDVHNRMVEIDHPVPAGSLQKSVYDADGLLSTVQDENHTSANTTYEYDALHRLTKVTQTLSTAPGGSIATNYGYDAMDNLSSVTDPNTNVTTYAYDDFHRMQSQTSPVSGTTSYSYDPAGNLVASTDANAAATSRTYDADNRLLSATSTRSGQPTEAVTYTFDNPAAGSYGKGRTASMTDPSGSTSYAYERRGLVRSEARTIQGDSYSTAFTYDQNGNRSGVTYPSGRLVSYTFDFADRPLTASSGATTFVSTASYLPFGPETSLGYGNGTTKSMTYDLRYRPLENKLTSTGGTIADYTYQEDAAGNITQIHDALDATYNRDFGYDDLHRLTTANSGTSLWGSGGYTYDSMGNMLTLTLGSARVATFSYSGTLPKLTSVVENGNSRAVTYDAAGNESAVAAAAYSYSARNFLTSGDGFSYTYNGTGLRTVTSGSVVLPPSITGFTPSGGPVGTVVTITGTSFNGATSVKFNGTAAVSYTVDSDSQVTATVPSGATTGTISLTTPAGSTTSASSFTVGPAPSITSFTPTSGAVGTSVTINGSNFTGATSVKFNGTSASFTVNTSIKVTATVPSGATTGPISVTSVTGTGTSATSFTVTALPSITSFTPTGGPVGTVVTITGTSFTGATGVKFNNTSATTFTVDSSTQIHATVPTHATTGPISVTTAAGTGTSSTNFTVGSLPTITSFTPTTGAVGTSVTINGSNFTGATSVKINGVSASFTVKTANKITATVPSGATTGPISVTTPVGTATSGTSFTVTGGGVVRKAELHDVDFGPESPMAVELTGSARQEREPVATVASLGAGFSATGETASGGFSWASFASNSGPMPLNSDFEAGVGPASASKRPARLRAQLLGTGKRYSFYSPEMNLIAESEIRTSAGAPSIVYEYVWFNGHPVAEIDGSTTHWTFADHLGTPILQTDSSAAMFWRAEYEPYGKVFALRTADQHQPLRLPGQEAEQFNLGLNGATERSYNIFRWYRSGWGRYTQDDPALFSGSAVAYAYAANNPSRYLDPLGLCRVEVRFNLLGRAFGHSWYHAYILITDDEGSVYFYRGGPSPDKKGPGMTGATASAGGGACCGSSGSNSSNGTSPGSGPGGAADSAGPWGPITTNWGEYGPGSFDWEAGEKPFFERMVLMDTPAPCECLKGCLENNLTAIENAMIPYNAFSTNSNATVSTALRNCGLGSRLNRQPPVWAPGWRIRLW